MIALTDNQVVAAITVTGSIIVAVIGLVGTVFAKMNSRQHDAAALERAKDRRASEEYRHHLDKRLGDLHTDVVQVRDIIVDHITDRSLHGG